MTTDTFCYLKRTTGSPEVSPESWLENEARTQFRTPPAWHWLELAPKRPLAGQARTFCLDPQTPPPLLAEGWPPPGIALDEARLFWSAATLYIIKESKKESKGCRWACWEESEQETDLRVQRYERPVLLRRDLAQRFACIAPLPRQPFRLIEYRHPVDQRLIAWRLLPAQETHPSARSKT